MRTALMALALVASVGCTSTTQNRCPSSSPTKCMTSEVCTWDPQKQCQVCHCDQPGFQPIEKDNPPSGAPSPGT
jgi:hypothetical protein